MPHYTKNIPRPDFKGEVNTDFKPGQQVRCGHAGECEVKLCLHAAVHKLDQSCLEPCEKKIIQKCTPP